MRQYVADAIRSLYAERIGHGVRVMEDPAVVELSQAREIAFCVCMTSNIQSGIAASLEAHPVRAMLSNGLNVTLNTDDPSISQIRLSDEYRKFCEDLGFPLAVLRERLLSAARGGVFTRTGPSISRPTAFSRIYTLRTYPELSRGFDFQDKSNLLWIYAEEVSALTAAQAATPFPLFHCFSDQVTNIFIGHSVDSGILFPVYLY